MARAYISRHGSPAKDQYASPEITLPALSVNLIMIYFRVFVDGRRGNNKVTLYAEASPPASELDVSILGPDDAPWLVKRYGTPEQRLLFYRHYNEKYGLPETCKKWLGE